MEVIVKECVVISNYIQENYNYTLDECLDIISKSVDDYLNDDNQDEYLIESVIKRLNTSRNGLIN